MYLQMVINLFIVIGFIFLYFALTQWVNKKRGGGKEKALKLLATLPLGSKERVILVQADNQRFLVGVTQQHISLLSTLTPKSELSSAEAATSEFNKLLHGPEVERITGATI